MRKASVGIILLTALQFSSANFLRKNEIHTFNNSKELHEKWNTIETNLKNGMDSILRYIFPLLAKANADLNITRECTESIHTTISALREYRAWAYHLVDASGKIPSGIFAGTVSEYGSYDQCLRIKAAGSENSTYGTVFTGQYCILELTAPLPTKPAAYSLHRPLPDFDNYTGELEIVRELMNVAHWGYFTQQQIGICVPSLCDKEDIAKIASLVETGLQVSVARCEVREQTNVQTEQAVIIVILCLVVILVLLASVADQMTTLFVGKKGESVKASDAATFERFVSAFSLAANFKKLVRTETNNPLDVLNGLRVLTVAWIIVAQTYFLMNWQFLRNLHALAENVSTVAFQALANAYVSVNTLFFVGGLLACYHTVKMVDKHGKESFGVLSFMLHRMFRYLPGFLLAIGLTLLLPLVGSGPVWHETIDSAVSGCKRNFWSNLLLANNLIAIPDACLPHSWYSAADFQIYQLVPLFFLFLFKNQFLGIAFIAVMIGGSVAAVGVINVLKGYPPVPLASLPDIENQVDLWQNLNKAHPYMAPYAIGLATGLILARNRHFSIPLVLQIVCWSLAGVCNLAVLYGTYKWNDRNNVVGSTLYAALHRTAWAAGIAWLTLMCATKRGGPIGSVLSWGCFVPLSRLTHLAYLLHYLVILGYMGSLRGKIDANNLVMEWLAVGNVVITFGLAFVCHLFFESPLLGMLEIPIDGLRKASCKQKRKADMSEGATFAQKPVPVPQGVVNATFDERL